MSISLLLWEYQESKAWKSYEDEEIETINGAIKSNKANVKLDDRTVNFAKMIEEGTEVKSVRCWIVENNSKLTWKWNEDGVDNYLPCKIAVKFSKNDQKSLKFQRNKISYNIDVNIKKIKNEKKGTVFDLEEIIEPLQNTNGKNVRITSKNKQNVNGDSTPSRKRQARQTKNLAKDQDDSSEESKDTKPTKNQKRKADEVDKKETKATKRGQKGKKEETKNITNDKKDETKNSKKSQKRKAEDTETDKVEIKAETSGKKICAPPVDAECRQLFSRAQVYCEGDDIYDAMLNQTNIEFNNNKYYLIQLLRENNNDVYYVWLRWGRVGKPGQNNLMPCWADLDKAKKIFKQKFTDKTKNDWEQRDKFVKVKGKYDLLKMDYNHEVVEKDKSTGKKIKREDNINLPESKLDKRLQYLVDLICNVKLMEDTVVEMNYDTKKAPLGKLTAEQVQAGYAALKKIDDCISKNQLGAPLLHACNDFYTRIPHDFGMKVPPIIRTSSEIRAKLDMLETLADIQVAMNILRDELGSDIHPVDRHYNALECELEPLDEDNSDYQLVKRYLENTHGQTHTGYSLDIEDIYRCNKRKEFKDVGNRMLLWHGSRLCNWAGILSQGLRIAPPEAPSTGYMFGKGIYFADMVSKSANYCMASRSKKEALLVLSEVSLGEPNQLLAANYNAHKLPPGKHSVQGMGSTAPDPTMEVKMEDGTRVPLGTPISTEVRNKNGYTLNYNEYIVYDPARVRFRFLVRVKFNYS